MLSYANKLVAVALYLTDSYERGISLLMKLSARKQINTFPKGNKLENYNIKEILNIKPGRVLIVSVINYCSLRLQKQK